jgi:hypothetical protein
MEQEGYTGRRGFGLRLAGSHVMPNASDPVHERRAHPSWKVIFSMCVFALLLLCVAVPPLVEWRIASRAEEDALRARDAIRIRRERAEREIRGMLAQIEQPAGKEAKEELLREIEESRKKWLEEMQKLNKEELNKPRSKYFHGIEFDDRIPLPEGVCRRTDLEIRPTRDN